jgi:hypothetical protein
MFMRLVSVIRMQPESEPTSAVPSPSDRTRLATEDCGLADDELETLDMLHLITLTS